MQLEVILLATGVLLATSLLIALGASKVGIPSLVAFLGLGMLIGPEGLELVSFNNVQLAENIAVVGLIAILFEGGMSTSWRRMRSVAIPATLLSTVGVLLTAIMTGVVAYTLFDVPLIYAMLIGAVVSSTDAAAVFASVRNTVIRRRLARTLEAESGVNDPMAIALTIGLVSWIQIPDYGFGNVALLLFTLIILGLIMGMVLGLIATQIFARLPHSLGAFAPVASVSTCVVTFGLTEIVGGSGFLAVYIVGLAIGSTPFRYRSQLTSFHEGLAFLAQVIMFIVLGLLVLPSNLIPVAGTSLLLALALMFIVRPVAVWFSTSFNKFSLQERLFLGWAGLRGAVPIVLAIFVLSSGIDGSETVFNIIFFVVLISALIQGSTIQWVANKLGVVDVLPAVISTNGKITIDRIEFVVMPQHAIVGSHLHEIGLPKDASIDHIKRGPKKITLRNDMTIKTGDRIQVDVPHSLHPELDDVFTRWRRRI